MIDKKKKKPRPNLCHSLSTLFSFFHNKESRYTSVTTDILFRRGPMISSLINIWHVLTHDPQREGRSNNYHHVGLMEFMDRTSEFGL